MTSAKWIPVKISFLIGAIVLLIATAYIVDRHIRSLAATRVSMFVSIDWVIRNDTLLEGRSPETIEAAIWQINQDSYKKIFPGGLCYYRDKGNEFFLRQNDKCFVSLFSRDRLVSSAHVEPKYESGGRVSK